MPSSIPRALARLIPLAAAAPLALSAQSASPAVASTLTPETYYACYVPNTGTVYRIKTADTPASCVKSTHVEFNWNNEGPVGPQGATGAQGVQGPQGPAGTVTLPFAGSVVTDGVALTVTQNGAGSAAKLQAGTGDGVWGRSAVGAGVHGSATILTSTAAGVRAEHASEGGTALDIVRGAIKVSGAGLNTHTAAFWTRFADMSPQQLPALGAYLLTIDHPLANGDPNALLTVTPRIHNGPTAPGDAPETLALVYDAAKARWQLLVQYDAYASAGYGAFNIMIVKP